MRRETWVNVDDFVFFVKGLRFYSYKNKGKKIQAIFADSDRSGIPHLCARTFEMFPEETKIFYQDRIELIGTDGHVRPWYPTIEDLLAEDWTTHKYKEGS